MEDKKEKKEKPNKVLDAILKYKKIILIAIPVIILIIILLCLLHPKKDYSAYEIGKIKEENWIDVRDALDDNNDLKFKSTKREIAYIYKNYKVKEANKNVRIDDDMYAKLLMIDSKEMKAKVIQYSKKIEEFDENIPDMLPPLIQIDDAMRDFKDSVLREIDFGFDDKPVKEKLYGENQYDFDLPKEESIYVEKRLYSLTYEIKDEFEEEEKKDTYDLNYYMKGDYLICELIKYLD